MMKTCPYCGATTDPTNKFTSKALGSAVMEWCDHCKAYVVPDEIDVKAGITCLLLIAAFLLLLYFA